MATSGGGHVLVAKTMRLLRYGFEKARNAVREKINQVGQIEARTEARTEHLYARIYVQEQPISKLYALRNGHQRRDFSTQKFIQRVVLDISKGAARTSPARYAGARTSARIAQSTLRAPFASTLRPNLTGGALSRSAGGYNVGAGGARYFSHGPAQPAEVIQNVSQAVRAFWLSGQRVQYRGRDEKTGSKRYRAVSTIQEKTRDALDRSSKASTGAFVDFKVSPTITAVGPLANVPKGVFYSQSEECPVATIADADIVAQLAVDFARALKDLGAIMSDIRKLAALGELPLLLHDSTTLRVRFPGCDAETVEALCRELNVRRGIVGQDEDFDEQHGAEMALLFPFAPSRHESENGSPRPIKKARKEEIDWQHMLSPGRSVSDQSHSFGTVSPHVHSDKGGPMGYMSPEGEVLDNPWMSSPKFSDYSSLHPSEHQEDVQMYFSPKRTEYHMPTQSDHDYDGIEGIYRFIEHCDRAR